MKSPEKDTTSSAVMCNVQLHPIGVTLSENPKLHNIPQEVSLCYSVSEKHMLQLQLLQQAKLLHIIRRKKQEQFLDYKDHQYKYRFGFR